MCLVQCVYTVMVFLSLLHEVTVCTKNALQWKTGSPQLIAQDSYWRDIGPKETRVIRIRYALQAGSGTRTSNG